MLEDQKVEHDAQLRSLRNERELSTEGISGGLPTAASDFPADIQLIQTKFDSYTQESGSLYCTPWNGGVGNAAGSTVAACQDLCNDDDSCVAITWFPSYGDKCYLFTSCDTTATSSSHGQVWHKPVLTVSPPKW